MIKRYYLFAAFGLIFGYTAQSNYWFVDERDVYFPITREQLQLNVRNTNMALTEKSAPNATILLNDIYNLHALKKASLQKEYLLEIKNYFYLPEKTTLNIKHKLNLLTALSIYWNSNSTIVGLEPNEYSLFLIQLAKNKTENILVRKQAYKNWLLINKPVVAENKKIQYNRLAQLVNFSDENLMNSISESEN